MPLIPSSDYAECAICQESKFDNGPIWRLEAPCGHDFHRDCLRDLLNHDPSSLCPLCRASISHTDQSGITAATPPSSPPPPWNPSPQGSPSPPWNLSLWNLSPSGSPPPPRSSSPAPLSSYTRPSSPSSPSPSRPSAHQQRRPSSHQRQPIIRTISPSDRQQRQPHTRYVSPQPRHQHYSHRYTARHDPRPTAPRQTWPQILQEAYAEASSNFVLSNTQSPEIAARIENLYQNLAPLNPRRGYEPTHAQLVNAFRSLVNGGRGSLVVDDEVVEWNVFGRLTDDDDGDSDGDGDGRFGRSTGRGGEGWGIRMGSGYGQGRQCSMRGYSTGGCSTGGYSSRGYSSRGYSTRDMRSNYDYGESRRCSGPRRCGRASSREVSYIPEEEYQHQRQRGRSPRRLEMAPQTERSIRYRSQASRLPRSRDETGLEEDLMRALSLSLETATEAEEEMMRMALEESMRR